MDRGSETQLQVTENLNWIGRCSKGTSNSMHMTILCFVITPIIMSWPCIMNYWPCDLTLLWPLTYLIQTNIRTSSRMTMTILCSVITPIRMNWTFMTYWPCDLTLLWPLTYLIQMNDRTTSSMTISPVITPIRMIQFRLTSLVTTWFTRGAAVPSNFTVVVVVPVEVKYSATES